MSGGEQVVLVADDGTVLGTTDKATVHGPDTPLHLAFSCHVSDGEGRLLVTRRALSKRTWPGVWTNSFCGHPGPAEDLRDAVARRALDELGVTLTDLELALPGFRYLATDAAGIVENELCPVFTARTDDELLPDPDEVVEYRWVDPGELASAVAAAPWAFSPWLTLQLPALAAR
ncbi:isopentenyl-diphosphate Delta-isomerase [Amnibacterium sp. CER49]|uniref:isopentenyl-diphosphate Delta-isomerase n=1 Tax=Amnibacterium sp. CER49 TaxID=3039161 RepID=UPI0024473D18|nr:isopentenyl-diphosphate Delta-isomerase [Amnibacterium sp. CER49]MDH2443668.1 isopentenyl-diphosphate Delta-isomerase [Amnibacterium sp. CER49]